MWDDDALGGRCLVLFCGITVKVAASSMPTLGGGRERVSVFISDFGSLIGTVLKDIVSRT